MSETFPVQTTPQTNEEGEVTGVVAQLDLTELANALRPSLADPDSEFTKTEVIPRPGAAPQTQGPHRYTIYVPHDEGAMINVGAAAAPFSPGISMATKTNISLRTMTSAPTSLSLGAPSEVGMNSALSGYGLFTEGASSHIAKQELLVESQEKGATLLAKQHVLVKSVDTNLSLEAQSGLLSATGKKIAIHSIDAPAVPHNDWEAALAVALIGLDAADTVASVAGTKGDRAGKLSITSETTNFMGGAVFENAEKLKNAWMAKASEHGTKVLTHVAALVTLYLSFKKSFSTPAPKKTKWEVRASKWKSLLALAKEVKSLYSDYGPQSDSEAPGISIKSDSSISIGGASKVTVNGEGGVAVTGGFGGVSLAGLSASMAGQKDAGISGGLGATVKALAGDVEVTSDLKGVTVRGKKDVEVNSESGKATLQGEQDTEVKAVTGKVLLSGKAGLWATVDNKFGVVVRDSFVELGKLKGGGEEIDGYRTDESVAHADFTDQGCTIASNGNEIHVNKNDIVVLAKKLEVKVDGTVTVKGSNVNIG